MSGVASCPYRYDPQGRIKSDGRYLCTWNQADQLIQVTNAASGAVIATYGYDGLGHRVRTQQAEGTVGFVFYDPSGRLLYDFHYTPGAPIGYASIHITLDGRAFMEQRTSGAASSYVDTWLHADWQGSARVATNASGAVLWREHYDP